MKETIICKNCGIEIAEDSKFCSRCGAEVVRERLTLKKLWANFTINFFGLDNKYLFTIWQMLINPEKVFGEYIQGVRKKYVKPFLFLAIGMTIALLVFNQFVNEYIEISAKINETQLNLLEEQFKNYGDTQKLADSKKQYIEEGKETQKSLLKYFNLFTFLLLPVYSLISHWVFGKPYNYAEHLIVNCYLQGQTFLVTTLCFVLSLFTIPSINFFSIPINVVYYLYAYRRAYKFGVGKMFINLIKFIGVLIGGFLLIIIGSAALAIIQKLVLG